MRLNERIKRLENGIDVTQLSDAELDRLARKTNCDLSRVSDSDLNKLIEGNSRVWTRLKNEGVITEC